MSWFWVIVIAFFVVRALMSMNKKTSTQDRQSQLRQQVQAQRGPAPGSPWPFSGSAPNVPPMGQPNAAWAPESQPSQPNAAWAPESQPAPPPAPTGADWQDRLAADVEARISAATRYVESLEASAPPQGPPLVDQLPAAAATAPLAVRAAVTAEVTSEPAPSPSPPLTSFAHERSDIGSAALESTLDSTIESSLFGSSPGPITVSVLPGAATQRLPAEIEAAVAAFMEAGQEVGAVRFLCDELGLGILDALRAAREVAGLPVS
ncbi:MAG: hypothetical protein H0X54_05935 [Propionibacteriales bacterium]|jgi:hypothetical protein|nr:hypothetical protein [Propionibacteriales bacterium]